MINAIRTLTQGRKTQSWKTKACGQYRSLNSEPGLARFASLRQVATFVLVLLGMAAMPGLVRGQEVAETIRIRTRVVFMDALVKDKRTGTPISDLTPENFEVLDDGKPRAISYFTREGQARKPLALVIVFDCREDGAGRFLKKPEIIKAMADELAKLPPSDEVGIMAMNIGEDEKRIWLTSFTNDKGQLTAALERLPAFVENDSDEPNSGQANPQERNNNSGTSSEASLPQPESKEADGIKSKEIVETETIKGRNGATVTRTTRADGSVDVKRSNRSGDVTVELDDIYDMAAAVRDATREAEKERPNSQPSIVWVSDGIAPIFFEDRDATEQILIRSNVIFNSLTVDLRTLFKFLLPIGKPIAGWMGVSLYGSAKRLAQQSGGEAIKVNRLKDYGAGLNKIFGNLTARYNLGFALEEAEQDDGRLHNLEVRVKAQDEKGKKRKLEVSARRGYYMTVATEKEASASKSQ